VIIQTTHLKFYPGGNRTATGDVEAVCRAAQLPFLRVVHAVDLSAP